MRPQLTTIELFDSAPLEHVYAALCGRRVKESAFTRNICRCCVFGVGLHVCLDRVERILCCRQPSSEHALAFKRGITNSRDNARGTCASCSNVSTVDVPHPMHLVVEVARPWWQVFLLRATMLLWSQRHPGSR